MIISAKANGDILNIKPEVFYQGSTEANKIYLIAPLVANSSVSIGFTLPNTTDIPVTLMTLSSAISDTLNTWVYEVPVALTQYVGIVKVNISVTTPTGKVITLKRCQFEVKRGDEVILPEEPEEDVYQRIVQALSQISAEFINKVDISYADGTTSQSISNNSNGLKLTKTVDGVTVTVEVTENGLEINGIEINSNIDAKVSAHNTSGTAHTDIREDISDILDGTTPVAEASHATRADTTDLTNVTDTINDVPISEIFEEDGKTAKLATADADGNNITETYATKVEILSKADLVEGKVPSSQLPSYVDDVEEVATFGDLPEVGEDGKIYVTLNTNLTYRWSGSEYVEISKSLALGETSATAYRGDRGKIAYDHSQVVEGNPHGTKTDDISDEEQLNKFVTNEEKTQIANAVPNTRTVNSKVLSDDIILNSDDISDTDKTNKWTDATEKEKVSKIVINGDGSKALLNDGTYGEVGTVDTVNGVLPDENKNITINADDISDTSTINKFATAEELAQIDTNAGNIADLQTEKIDKVYSTDYAYTDGLVFTWVTDHYIVGDGTTTAGNGYTGTATTIVIPKYYDDGVHGIALVTGIGQFAFSGKFTITSVTIPSSVTSIGDGAFFNCDSLTNITIPSSVTSIGFSTFQSCNSLINITIPNSVTSINDQAFAECTSLTSITMEATTPATLGADVFIYSGITTTTGAIYVPYASLTAYKTAENWSAFADIIFAIPDGELIQELSDKLDTIEEGAEVNVIETVKVNGTALTPTLKVVDITVPVDAGDVGALPDTTKYGATIDLTYTALTGELEVTLKDQDGAELSSDNVDLPMELIIESGTVETCTVDDEPVVGYVVGDKYIDLVLANESHIYILVSELIDQITIEETGDGNAVTDISVNGNVITETKGKTFVEAVAGKGLSTNDYDATEKEKVSKIVINGDGSKALLNDGTYGEVGTVDTVNGVLPDENKNITIDADDISDTSTINKFATAEELAQIATNTGDITDLESNKADKVSGATDGNIAELDSYGNLKDSGVDISDFVPVSAIVNDLTTGGTDVPLSAEQGKVLNTNKEDIANKNVNNGYCPLDSGGKVPLANLPSSLLKYQGVWNASTNTPTLTNPDLTKIGYVYNVSVAGTQFDIDFSLGDWLIYNASGIPEKSDNSDDVVSVNGQTGAVVLNTSHISATTDKNYVTDAEKTKLGNVLEKTTTGDTRRVYGINSSNEQELTEIEETPTASSAKLVTSGGVKTALDNKATKLSIGQWNVPYRDEAGSGEPNTSRLATMTSPLPSAILIRDADGKATFVGGTSDSQGIVKSQLDSAVENMVTTNTEQTITGVKTFNAPTNIALTEQTTAKFMTSNGGSVTIGKEGPNSGVMLRFDQVDGTERLKFRGSATAGAMVWSQPENGSALYMDLKESNGTTRRLTFNALQINHPVKISSPIIQGTTFTNGTKTYTPPSSNGTLALTSDIPTTETTNASTGTVSQTLTPNVYYKFTGAPTTLTLTLGTAVSGKMNEYMFQFVANSSGTTLTAISGVTWVGGTPTITANKTYQASILNGYGIIVQVD